MTILCVYNCSPCAHEKLILFYTPFTTFTSSKVVDLIHEDVNTGEQRRVHQRQEGSRNKVRPYGVSHCLHWHQYPPRQ